MFLVVPFFFLVGVLYMYDIVIKQQYSLLLGLFSFILFVIFTPGIFITPPRKSSIHMIAVLHAILFVSIMCVVMYFFKENLAETLQNYDSPVMMTPSPAENVTSTSCPAGQNWISGTNRKYGYCSKSTLSDILSDVSQSPPSPSSDTLSNCPAGQNWITGSNKKYGYCSSSSVNDVLTSTQKESTEIYPIPGGKVNTNLPTSSYTQPSKSIEQNAAVNSCPNGQNWVTGSNTKYGYCSTSSTTDILSEMTPSSSSMFTISPTHLS